jgi:predicted aspartyl protease
MPGMAPALVLLASAALQDAAPAAQPADTAGPEIEGVRTDRERRMTVPVTIEGQGPFRFIIDTGSQKTVLADHIAARLGLRSAGEVTVVGVAGRQVVQTAEIDNLGLGRLLVTTITVPLFESNNIGADGIVGTDSLQNQRVLLNFVDNEIAVGDEKSLGGNRGYEIVVRARRRAGQLIMTNANVDGVRTSVIIDTGSGTSVGNRALQNALTRRGGITGQVTLKSITGQSVTADLGVARKLAIRGVDITNLIIAFTDTPAFTELKLDKRPALFLGMRELRLFKRVAVDFGKRRVMFDLPPAE